MSAAKGARSWQFAGLPIAVHVSSATNPSLLSPRLFVADEPRRLIGDKAYDSDALDAALAKRGIEMIAPHRSNRIAKTQDGRPPEAAMEDRTHEQLVAELPPR